MNDPNTSRPRRQPRGKPNYDNRTAADDDAEPTVDAAGRTWPAVKETDLPADIILPRLAQVRQSGPGQWSACCPAHGDTRPSLSITERADYTLYLHCHSGVRCDAESITAALGLTPAYLFASGYAVWHAKKTGRTANTPTGRARPTVPGEITPDPQLAALAKKHRRHPDAGRKVLDLCDVLGVTAPALWSLGVGWCAERSAWAIPERDDRGRVVGIAYRYATGRKDSERGGHRGLYLPRGADERRDTIYLPEGMSDTAAILSSGGCAIGRPMAKATAHVRHWLAQWLTRYAYGREVLVIGDADDAGRDGARDLAHCLTTTCGRPVGWAMPRKHKDARELVAAGKWPHGLKIQNTDARSAT